MSGPPGRLLLCLFRSILLNFSAVKKYASNLCDRMSRKKQTQDPEKMPALQILREAAGLTQSALARQIPDKTRKKTLSQKAISNWETGKDEPELTVPQIKALCRALGISIDQLPDDLGPPKRFSSDDVEDGLAPENQSDA
jgi:putative transcriptional regulator